MTITTANTAIIPVISTSNQAPTRVMVAEEATLATSRRVTGAGW